MRRVLAVAMVAALSIYATNVLADAGVELDMKTSNLDIRAARQGRNPATGETIMIAASKKLTFSPAKNARDTVSAAPAMDRAAAD